MDIPAFGFRPEIMNGSGIGGNAWMRRAVQCPARQNVELKCEARCEEVRMRGRQAPLCKNLFVKNDML